KAQRKRIESLGELVVKEEAAELMSSSQGKPVMKLLDLEEGSLRKLALKIAESDNASAVLINRSGNIVAAAGKNSGQSAKALLEWALKELGGSGGGNDRIAQGKAQKAGVVKLD
ncbi:MAG: DHHA1 domain-containing protein, partial [Candidatus Micrarchaeota archaeon]